MANLVSINEPPVNYASQGAIACKSILVDAPRNLWLGLKSLGAPGAGEGNGWAGPGSVAIDVTNAVMYLQTGTLAATVWTAIGGGAAVTPISAASLQLDTGTKTATATAGAATLNKMSGKITSEALTTAGLADYTLTLTNSDIAAADIVLVSVGSGTNTQGDIVCGAVKAAAGSVTIVVRNSHATQALNGTIVISFAVLKN